MVWLLGVARVDRVGRFWRVRAPDVNWQVYFMCAVSAAVLLRRGLKSIAEIERERN
jgi:hypothetical protein